MVAIIPVATPLAEHFIEVKIQTTVDEVDIREIKIGDEYPYYYSVFEYFPSLANSIIKKRLSLNSEMKCRASREITGDSFALKLSDCSLVNDKKGFLWDEAKIKLAKMCPKASNQSAKESIFCKFSFSPADKKPTRLHSIQSPSFGDCRWHGETVNLITPLDSLNSDQSIEIAERRKNTLASNIAKRTLYIIGRVDEAKNQDRRGKESKELENKKMVTSWWKGRDWLEFLFGGSLPTKGSDGSDFIIKTELISEPVIIQSNKDYSICKGQDGAMRIEFSKIGFSTEFLKNRFKLEGEFIFTLIISSRTVSALSRD